MLKLHINSVGVLNIFNLCILVRKIVIYFVGQKCNVGQKFKAGASGRHKLNISLACFRIKNYLRNPGNTRNNEKVVYFPFSYQKRAYFDVTSGNFDSEKVHKHEMFGQQYILQFFSRESRD